MQNHSKKSSLFTLEERLEMIRKLYQNMNNIKVISARGAAVDVALLNECKAIIRGLRSLSDYDYEVQLQQINKEISSNEVNTVCLFADKDYQFISSSMVKEVFRIGLHRLIHALFLFFLHTFLRSKNVNTPLRSTK